MWKLVLVLFVLSFAAGDLRAQQAPESYAKDEFPPWLTLLRRSEIIFVGSIPFTLFLSFEVYDVYRFFANGLDARYSPWPFGASRGIAYTQQEQIGVALASLVLSMGVTVADYILGLSHEGRESDTQPSAPES